MSIASAEKILEALGLSGHRVASLDIKLRPNETPVVVAEIYLDDSIETTLRQFKLVDPAED